MKIYISTLILIIVVFSNYAEYKILFSAIQLVQVYHCWHLLKIPNIPEGSIKESSHLHIRQKRVINLDKDGSDAGRPIWIENAPYIVNIREDNTTVCAGSILSAVFVLAPASCVFPPLFGSFRSYTILSGSASRNSGTSHTIERRLVVVPSPILVLLEVSPHFDFQQSPNRPISLFLGVVPHIAYGIFSGWGCTQPGNFWHTAVYPEELRQTRLYIIPLADCIRIYQGRLFISNMDICTLDTTKRRGTCIGDLGGSLAVQFPPLMAPHLLGVMSTVRRRAFGEDPDVFTNLNYPAINLWNTDVINNHAIP